VSFSDTVKRKADRTHQNEHFQDAILSAVTKLPDQSALQSVKERLNRVNKAHSGRLVQNDGHSLGVTAIGQNKGQLLSERSCVPRDERFNSC